jgi:hypothetical protein
VVAQRGYFPEVPKYGANPDHSCLGTHVHRITSVWIFYVREFLRVLREKPLKPEVSKLQRAPIWEFKDSKFKSF